MNPETIKNTIQAIIDGLTPLAQKLAVPLEKVFNWAIRENYVQAIYEVIFGIILAIAIFYEYKFIKWGLKKKEEGSKNNFYRREGIQSICIVIGIILGVAFLIFSLCAIPDIMRRVINPEYHALMDIVKLLGLK